MIICALPKGENSKEYNHAGGVSCRSILLFVTLYYGHNEKYLLLQEFSKKLTKSTREKEKYYIRPFNYAHMATASSNTPDNVKQ